MEAKDWIALVALAVSGLSLWFSWSRTADAKVKAKAAADRADEALDTANKVALRIETHLTGKEERDRAELEAGQILETWIAKIREHRQAKGETYACHLDVPDLASEIALDRLREQKDKLHIHRIERTKGNPQATVVHAPMPPQRPVIHNILGRG